MNGEDITGDEEKMGKLGLSFVKDDEGRQVKHPVFLQGGRSILLSGNLMLPAFKSDEGGYMFLQEGELEATMNDFLGDEPAGRHREIVEEALNVIWTQESRGLSWEDYLKQEWDSVYFNDALRVLEGYGRESGKEYGKNLRVLAAQFKGVGLSRYIYHAVRKNKDDTVELQEGDVLLQVGDQGQQKALKATYMEFAQRPEYEGMEGIFLDVRHQFWEDNPTGGLSNVRKGVERDMRLLAEGARMSGVTMGYVPLLTRVQLEEVDGEARMVCDEIIVWRCGYYSTTRTGSRCCPSRLRNQGSLPRPLSF